MAGYLRAHTAAALRELEACCGGDATALEAFRLSVQPGGALPCLLGLAASTAKPETLAADGASLFRYLVVCNAWTDSLALGWGDVPKLCRQGQRRCYQMRQHVWQHLAAGLTQHGGAATGERLFLYLACLLGLQEPAQRGSLLRCLSRLYAADDGQAPAWLNDLQQLRAGFSSEFGRVTRALCLEELLLHSRGKRVQAPAGARDVVRDLWFGPRPEYYVDWGQHLIDAVRGRGKPQAWPAAIRRLCKRGALPAPTARRLLLLTCWQEQGRTTPDPADPGNASYYGPFQGDLSRVLPLLKDPAGRDRLVGLDRLGLARAPASTEGWCLFPSELDFKKAFVHKCLWTILNIRLDQQPRPAPETTGWTWLNTKVCRTWVDKTTGREKTKDVGWEELNGLAHKVKKYTKAEPWGPLCMYAEVDPKKGPRLLYRGGGLASPLLRALVPKTSFTIEGDPVPKLMQRYVLDNPLGSRQTYHSRLELIQEEAGGLALEVDLCLLEYSDRRLPGQLRRDLGRALEKAFHFNTYMLLVLADFATEKASLANSGAFTCIDYGPPRGVLDCKPPGAFPPREERENKVAPVPPAAALWLAVRAVLLGELRLLDWRLNPVVDTGGTITFFGGLPQVGLTVYGTCRGVYRFLSAASYVLALPRFSSQSAEYPYLHELATIGIHAHDKVLTLFTSEPMYQAYRTDSALPDQVARELQTKSIFLVHSARHITALLVQRTSGGPLRGTIFDSAHDAMWNWGGPSSVTQYLVRVLEPHASLFGAVPPTSGSWLSVYYDNPCQRQSMGEGSCGTHALLTAMLLATRTGPEPDPEVINHPPEEFRLLASALAIRWMLQPGQRAALLACPPSSTEAE